MNTLVEFENQVYTASAASAICSIPSIRRLGPSSINIRIDLTTSGFIDAFFNEVTGTTAFALIEDGQRVFGADNTGGWHMHPFDDPALHEPLLNAVSFAEFLAAIERHASQ